MLEIVVGNVKKLQLFRKFNFCLKVHDTELQAQLCHVAPSIWIILLKNIFTNFFKISRLTRSFTNFSPKNYDPLSGIWF